MGGGIQALPEAKPFLKWAGSKKWLVPHIRKYLPPKFNNYYEPFLGSGALFFALKPRRARLSDINRNIINTYLAIRDNPGRIISQLKSMHYGKHFYYDAREEFNYKVTRLNNGKIHYRLAALTLYLNRTCWNGLYRENSRGEFNVPIGSYSNPKICDEQNLQAASRALRDVSFDFCDFEDAVKNAKAGDFVFFDPPYITGHRNNGFHAYNEKLFSWDDQTRLAQLTKELHRKRCHVLITNADHESIEELYQCFRIYSMPRQSLIAADIKNRRLVKEFIITNYNLLNN